MAKDNSRIKELAEAALALEEKPMPAGRVGGAPHNQLKLRNDATVVFADSTKPAFVAAYTSADTFDLVTFSALKDKTEELREHNKALRTAVKVLLEWID
jgi:hypothetical protein